MTLSSWETLTIFVGGIVTLAIYSFLIKENSVYRFFEHLYIGIAAGMAPIFVIKTFMWPKILEPMFGLNIVQFPDGTTANEYMPLNLLYLLPIGFGLLYYTIYTKRFSWMVKLVIGLSLGANAGLFFKGFFAKMVPQIVASFKPLVVMVDGAVDWLASFNHLFFVTALLLVMYYFFFTFRRSSAVSEGASKSGRWLMMICFGSFFGSTVMARLALLVERVQFLIIDWFGMIKGFVS